jgi:hypothetical protein
MEEHIKQIAGIIESIKGMTARTPFLHVALGNLETALANAREHVVELGRQAAAKVASQVQSRKSKG